MADITMCKDDKCPYNKTCHRYNANPNEERQSYFAESPREGDKCDMYWDDTHERMYNYLKEIMGGSYEQGN